MPVLNLLILLHFYTNILIGKNYKNLYKVEVPFQKHGPMKILRWWWDHTFVGREELQAFWRGLPSCHPHISIKVLHFPEPAPPKSAEEWLGTKRPVSSWPLSLRCQPFLISLRSVHYYSITILIPSPTPYFSLSLSITFILPWSSWHTQISYVLNLFISVFFIFLLWNLAHCWFHNFSSCGIKWQLYGSNKLSFMALEMQ